MKGECVMKPFLERLPLVAETFDRDAARRTHPNLDEMLRTDPDTRAVLVHGDTLFVTPDGRALARLPLAQVPAFERGLYLGRAPGPLLLVSVSAENLPRVPAAEGEWASLRDAASHLTAAESAIATAAIAMVHWHRSHAFSPLTGEPADVGAGGWVRTSPSTGAEVFPRTDPAIIVGVRDRHDRILLARHAGARGKIWTVLAGFVEPGESFEQTVVREVLEESGMRVTHPRYLGSQPWPFPASVMVGFFADLEADQDPAALVPQPDEIAELRWFDRSEVPSLPLPARVSIARAIIEEWYGAEIPDAPLAGPGS